MQAWGEFPANSELSQSPSRAAAGWPDWAKRKAADEIAAPTHIGVFNYCAVSMNFKVFSESALALIL